MRTGETHLMGPLPRLEDVSAGPLTRTDWAEQLLRGEILTGTLRPAERLKIGELQERYPGMSPTPLREALSRLAGSGLVEVLPNRGMRVAPGSVEDLRDVYANRALLESIALERSLTAADTAWQADARQALDDFIGLSERMGEIVEIESAHLIHWENSHRRFHFALISRCGSPWLLRLIGVLYEQSVRYRYLTIRAHPDFHKMARVHEEIYRTALAGTVEESVHVLRKHLELTVESAKHLDEGFFAKDLDS